MSNQALTQEKAVEILIQGVMVSQKRGAYSLEEAALLNSAVNMFIKQPSKQTPPSAGGSNVPENTTQLGDIDETKIMTI